MVRPAMSYPLSAQIRKAIWDQAYERQRLGEATIVAGCDICDLPIMDDDDISRSSPESPGGEGTFHEDCAFPGSAA